MGGAQVGGPGAAGALPLSAAAQRHRAGPPLRRAGQLHARPRTHAQARLPGKLCSGGIKCCGKHSCKWRGRCLLCRWVLLLVVPRPASRATLLENRCCCCWLILTAPGYFPTCCNPFRSHWFRVITRGALQALAYCHEAGVVHGALGSGSIMLSTFDDRSYQRLVVKLDNVRERRSKHALLRCSCAAAL